MICKRCENQHHDNTAKYCTDCGTDLYNPKLCNVCGAAHSENQNFCGSCGKDLKKN